MTYYGNKFRGDQIGDPKPAGAKKKSASGTGESKIFHRILRTRVWKSFISEDPIFDPQPINFLHVLPKGQNKYPEFKLLDTNIVLGTAEEHHLWDHQREDLRQLPEWNEMFELEEYLLELYGKLEKKR